MPIFQKAQFSYQEILHFGGSPALLFFQLGQQFCLVCPKRLVPAEIIVGAVQSAERIKQILHILGGLGCGQFSVRVKSRLLSFRKPSYALLVRGFAQILALIDPWPPYRLVLGVDLRQQLIQGGLGRQGRRAAGQQTGRQGQGTASYKTFHVCLSPFHWRRRGTGMISV